MKGKQNLGSRKIAAPFVAFGVRATIYSRVWGPSLEGLETFQAYFGYKHNAMRRKLT